jgi:CheY-like chemotaxis protein
MSKMDTCALQIYPYPRPAMQTSTMLSFDTHRKLPTLLLIDDDMVSREVAATVLTMSGYTVHTATGGALALEMRATQQCAPGVVLMDAQMPGISGTELIAALRGRTKAHIFALSGSNPPHEVMAAVDGFLLKPFDAEALEKLLEGHPLPGALLPSRSKGPDHQFRNSGAVPRNDVRGRRSRNLFRRYHRSRQTHAGA